MNFLRAIPIGTHAAIEMLFAPLLLVAPFVFGFGYLAGAVSIALGVILIGLAVSIYGGEGAQGSLPLSAHAGLDFVIAGITIVLGLVIGLATGDAVATIFMVGFGAAHMALTASTRYSRPLGT